MPSTTFSNFAEEALQWLMLDEDGPKLLWQLQPLVKTNVDNGTPTQTSSPVAGGAAPGQLGARTLASLLEESGCSSIREWGTMECQRS